MADKYLSFEEFLALADSAIRTEFPQINPSISGHWATAFVRSICGAGIAIQSQVKDLERELFPQTATGAYLDNWGEYDGLTRNIATKSSGVLGQEGVAGTIIPVGAIYYAETNDRNYTVLAQEIIQTKTVDIATAVNALVGGQYISTITTQTNHDYVAGVNVTIGGVISIPPGIFNGTYYISAVVDSKTFQYINTPPASTATPGTGTASVTCARVDVEALETGASGDLSPGITLALTPPIVGAAATACVINGGIAGGQDEETDATYRSRILISRSELEGVFTKEQVRRAALTVVGNTRAFVVTPNDVVQPGTPAPGQVQVYILRDNDVSPLPDASIRIQTKNAIIEYGKLPANTSTDDLFVLAPTLVTTNFVFNALSPNITSMRNAVKGQLKAFFEDAAEFGVNVPRNSYLAAIQNTRDPETGEFLKTFNLTAPVGDIIVPPGSLAYLGTVTFV